MDEYRTIDEHPQYCDLLDYVKKYGNCTKKELIEMLYDESGQGETKSLLKLYSFGELLMMIIDDIYGGNSH